MKRSKLKVVFCGLVAACLAGGATTAGAVDCGLYDYRARVTDVIDGDTVRADIDLGFSTWRNGESLRLWGIDAPELRRREERARAERARAALAERVLGRELIVCTIEDRRGSFNRYLAVLYTPAGENINEWLLAAGHAVPYERD
jgi:micrococcal nuclease